MLFVNYFVIKDNLYDDDLKKKKHTMWCLICPLRRSEFLSDVMIFSFYLNYININSLIYMHDDST